MFCGRIALRTFGHQFEGRFISVVKKKNFIKMDQFEDVLWKFMFPIFLAVSFALTHKLLKSAASEIQQVRKY